MPWSLLVPIRTIETGQVTRPLHEAAESCNPKTVKALLAVGADPNVRDQFGDAPLHAAAGGNRDSRTAEVVGALIAGGADPDTRNEVGEVPLIVAVRGDNARTAYALVTAGADPNVRDASGDTPLHLAAWLGSDSTSVRLPVAAGADPDARASSGNTPLHLAAWAGSAKSVEALIIGGADPNSRTDNDDTPLHLWARSDFGPEKRDSVAVLLDAGADARVRNTRDETPWDVLQQSANLDAVRGSDAYWLLNDARFRTPVDDEIGEADLPLEAPRHREQLQHRPPTPSRLSGVAGGPAGSEPASRRCAARTQTPPAECRRSRRVSSASCLRAASQGASACG